MRFPTFSADEIRTFLTAVDRNLTGPARIILIGGSAAALAHRVTSTTDDIDTYNPLTPELVVATVRAGAQTGLKIPMTQSTVADLPWDADKRLERQLPELQMLEVLALEKHDLALSKAVRGDEHDLQQIGQMHQNEALSFDVLVQRFRDERSHAIGDPNQIRDRFLGMVEALFGELKRIAADRMLAKSAT